MKSSFAMAVVSMLAITVGGAIEAAAATLVSSTGPVQVDVGGGFKSASAMQALPPGSRVTVKDGGVAKIAFTPTCIIDVTPGQVYTVPLESPCVLMGDFTLDGLFGQGSLGTGLGGLPNYALIAGGVGAAAGIGTGVYFATKPSRPASP